MHASTETTVNEQEARPSFSHLVVLVGWRQSSGRRKAESSRYSNLINTTLELENQRKISSQHRGSSTAARPTVHGGAIGGACARQVGGRRRVVELERGRCRAGERRRRRRSEGGAGRRGSVSARAAASAPKVAYAGERQAAAAGL